MATITWSVQVDWGNLETAFTGATFAGANDDITADVISIHCARGKRWDKTGFEIGEAELVMDNQNNKYSPENASGALFGNLQPNRRIRIRSTAPIAATLWSGFIDEIVPHPDPRVKTATIYCKDGFGWLDAKKPRRPVAVGLFAFTSPSGGDCVAKQILDEAGWPSGDRTLQDADAGGSKSSSPDYWWCHDDLTALGNLAQAAEEEGSLIYMAGNGKFVFEDRHTRMLHLQQTSLDGAINSSVTSVVVSSATNIKVGHVIRVEIERMEVTAVSGNTLTVTRGVDGTSGAAHATGTGVFIIAKYRITPTNGAAIAARYIRPKETIKNESLIAIAKRTAAALGNIWTATSKPSIKPGQSRIIKASYTNPATGQIVPVANTDYTANSAADGSGTDLTASVTMAGTVLDGQGAEIKITNNHATLTAYMTLLKIRGQELTKVDETAFAEDATSKTTYGERTIARSFRWMTDVDEAQRHADADVGFAKDPRPILQVSLANKTQAILEQQLQREISDVIRVNETNSGIDEDWYIDRIEHQIDMGNTRLITTWELSNFSDNIFWILGVSALNTDTRLGY